MPARDVACRLAILALLMGAVPVATWAFQEASSSSKPSTADTLPPDGSWSRWKVTVVRKESGEEFSHTLTISSVGTISDGLKTSRWIELKMEESDVTTIVKLLIPEEDLLKSDNPTKQLLRGWEKIGSDARTIDPNRAQLYAVDLLWLPGPLQMAKRKPEPKVVDIEKGRLEIAESRSGRQDVEISRGDGKATFKTEFSGWSHADVKLGFAAARTTTRVDLNGTALSTIERQYDLEDTGTKATSALANYE